MQLLQSIETGGIFSCVNFHSYIAKTRDYVTTNEHHVA